MASMEGVPAAAAAVPKRSTLDDPFAHSDGSEDDASGAASGLHASSTGGGGLIDNSSFPVKPLRSAMRLSSRRSPTAKAGGGDAFGDDEDGSEGTASDGAGNPAASSSKKSAEAAEAAAAAAARDVAATAAAATAAARVSAQDVDDELWRARRKHVFVLSSAGKPIFTRYGDESDFSELFGILQVLISMAQSSSIRGSAHDALRRVTCGPGFAMHFLIQEELYFVMVTRTEESPRSCVRQLKLLYHQLQSVLPTVNAVLRKNPGYDIRRIFSDRDAAVMRALIKRMSCEPSFLLRAQQAGAMAPDTRRELGRILLRTYRGGAGGGGPNASGEDDGNSSHGGGDQQHIFSFITHQGLVLATAGLQGQDKVHVEDVLLLMNFVACLCSTQAGEIWAPFCMPRFNDSGYLWCYVMNLSEQARLAAHVSLDTSESSPYARTNGVLLIQLATAQEAFPILSDTAYDLCAALGLAKIESLERSIARDTEFPIQAVATQQLDPAAVDGDASLGGGAGGVPNNSSLSGSRSSVLASTLSSSSAAGMLGGGGGGVIDPLLWIAVVTESQQLVTSAWPTLLKHSKSERKLFLRLMVQLRDKLMQVSTANVPTILHSVELYSVLVQRQHGVGDVYAMFLPCTTKRFMAAAGALIARAVKAKESSFTFVKNVQFPAQ